MADQLILGGIGFDSFSTPTKMGAGGRQAMVVHKLPGGARVIDTLGPDDDSIAWSGEFYGNDSFPVVLALDAMRAQGKVIQLTFAGQQRDVIIESFSWHLRRYPAWIEYNISCVVYRNASLGDLAAKTGTVDTQVATDLNDATIAASDNEANQLAIGMAP